MVLIIIIGYYWTNNGCISGDAKVQIKSTNMKATRRVTLDRLYKLYKNDYYSDLYIKSLINGRFDYIPIKTIVDKGIRDCVKIQLEDTELICTPDHLILTTDGWIEAGNLKSNDIVLTNGQLVCKNCGSTKDICKTPYGKFYGYCRTCMYKLRNGTKFKDDSIVREINSDGYIVLKGKGTRDFPSYKRRYGLGVLEHDHINSIKTDNRLENLQLMITSEYAKLYSLNSDHKSNLIQFDTTKTHYIKGNATVWLSPKQSKVISVNKTQSTHVYDIEIDDNEIHNFVANGVVVHNCGKTLQAITIARYKKQHQGLKHCLIVCGVNSLKYNWQREVEKFCKDEKAIILGTRINKKGKIVSITVEETKQQIQDCPKEFFWIINIERIRYDKEEFKQGTDIINYFNKLIEDKELGMLILDEAHKIKNLQSKQAQGLQHLNTSIDKLLMTGTLLVNNPYDLYCPMSLCGLINYNKFLFERKFVIKDDFGNVLGYQNMDELHNILYKSSLRRTKDLLDLPDKIYKQEWLEFTKEEQDVFDQILGIKPFNLDKIEFPEEVVATITRMRQATVAGQLLISKKVPSTKFDRLNDILEEAKMNDQKVLVFCPFTEALKLGLEYCKGYNPKLVCGGMGTKVQEVVDEHENTEGFSVLFAQETTLGVGYTLVNTSICVFLSPPWSRATYDQCSDRIHRIGQKHTVQIIDLLIKDTYDEIIYKKLHGKGAMSDAIIDGEEIDGLQTYFKDMGIEFNKKEHKETLNFLDSIKNKNI